ncbi:hypothetical protein N7454_005329 [Penicillium verhagenii]|nr:hypothetical protein N7454_005329 [Penicillium verhagenii]
MLTSTIVVFALSITVSTLARPHDYANRCGDNLCPEDKPTCCEVTRNGVPTLDCFDKCPPPDQTRGAPPDQTRGTPPDQTRGAPPDPTRSPPPAKCGYSFFCPIGQVCCPNALYHCADPDKISQQCPK